MMRQWVTRAPRRRVVVVLGAISLVAVVVGSALAAAGDLDPAFSGDGKFTIDFPGEDSIVARDVLVRPDGVIVLAGESTVGNSGTDFTVQLLRADGADTLDEAFVDLGLGVEDRAEAVARQADGALVLVGETYNPGSSNGDLAVARLTAALLPDPTFDADGRKTIEVLGPSEKAWDVLVQPDGKIVVVGDTAFPERDVAVVRLNANGSFDASFDGDGVAVVSVGAFDSGRAVTLQADGKLVVVGRTRPDNVTLATDMIAVRLNANGSLDTSFDGDGKKTIDLLGADIAEAVLVQPDGKLVLAGTGNANPDFALVRLNADGSFDTSFDGDGIAGVDLGGADGARDVALRPDGRLVAGGFTGADMALVQLTAGGSLDTAFDLDGKKTIGFGVVAVGEALALQADGSVVLAGGADVPANLVVARVLGEPPPPAPPSPSAPPAAGGPLCAGRPATIVGTKGDDRLNGTAGDDVIVALGGRDVIKGLGGNDVICAGGGPDVVRAGEGDDVVLGQAGPDELRGGPGSDSLSGGKGADTLRGGPGEDSCVGDKGPDSGFACESGEL